MRRDLWRLATPLLAVGVSFIVVLIIGASSTGGSPNPKPTPTPSAQHSVDLTIMAVAQPAGQGQPQNSQSALAPSATHSSSNGGVAIPGTQPTSESPSSSVSSSSPAASASPSARVLPGGSTVTVLNATTLRLVVTHHLNTHNSYTTHVPEQSYLVCLRPPKGWGSASGDILSLGSWICKQIGPGPAKVTFGLVPPSASASGAGK